MSPGLFVLLFAAFHTVLGLLVFGLAAWVMMDDDDGSGETDGGGGDGGIRPRRRPPRPTRGRERPLRRSGPHRPGGSPRPARERSRVRS